jgi:biopolymer transport protein ExbB
MLPTRSSAWFVVAVLALLLPQSAFAWWSDDWAFRKELRFDLSSAGANISSAPVDVPVLVRLSLANFEFFADTKPDGSDFRFIASDDKTALNYHIERYDPQTQIALIWVKVPRLTPGVNTDTIYIYYGNEDAPPASNPAATYDANQVLVYQFGPAAGQPQDSTAYKTEPSAFTAEIVPASLIGAGVRLNGATNIVVPATSALRFAPSQGLTLSAWVRIETPQARAHILSLGDDASRIVLGIDGTRLIAQVGPVAAPIEVAQPADGIALGNWHHVALRLDGGSVSIALDGVDVGSAPAVVPEVAGTLTIGGSGAGSFLVGDLDEVTVANVPRPTEWLRAVALSQGMVAPLVVYGNDTQNDSGGESYFATTLRNVTVDGWVVIAILAVMFFWAAWIMAAKAIFLSRVQKGNQAFLAEFRKMRDDPAAIERRVGSKTSEENESAFEQGGESELVTALTASKDTFGASTLFRLYHHGMRETLQRLEGQAAGADRTRTLSPAAIESIRATMDASMTRMTQRLNSQMVLLTIAISGGPFLGLLGTVIGVLIVFAAIAATGDVNINAIAPGTAAALVATVAGLGVAIPCLFGYNWLNTKIKEIVADMRVFVDEFVTRIAESYT